jgi:hypothetical protein
MAVNEKSGIAIDFRQLLIVGSGPLQFRDYRRNIIRARRRADSGQRRSDQVSKVGQASRGICHQVESDEPESGRRHGFRWVEHQLAECSNGQTALKLRTIMSSSSSAGRTHRAQSDQCHQEVMQGLNSGNRDRPTMRIQNCEKENHDLFSKLLK